MTHPPVERGREPSADEIVRVCRYIAKMPHALGWACGEPAIELAGTYVSVCAIDPEFAAAFAETGNSASVDMLGRFDAMRNGCLTYRTKDGRILAPADGRNLSGEPDN